MHHRRSSHDWPARVALLLLALLPAVTRSGDWHQGRTLICSDCHTMHNSKGGLPMRYDAIAGPVVRLLRAESATAVCLACHRGDRPTSRAPAVMAPSNWDPPGGGFPADLSDPAHHAHAISADPLLPPLGDTAVPMTCLTCHEAHGNDAYRNLRASPSGTGRSSKAPVVRQVKAAGTAPPAEVYSRANVRYVSDMTAWCLDCHNRLGTDHAAGDPLLQAHPWDRPIFGSAKADYAWWSGVTTNRVPVQNSLGVPAPNENDQVFCLSCHKAHGSPNDAAFINADDATWSSTCQQCHNV
jgi:Doubled CXXCH motif (Paired_CXXCH_1)